MPSVVTDAALIDRLAQQVLHWGAAPGRFVLPNRSWTPKWKFNPIKNIADAFRLLDGAAPTRYCILFSGGRIQVEIEVKGRVGKASGESAPRTIALGIARALGLVVS